MFNNMIATMKYTTKRIIQKAPFGPGNVLNSLFSTIIGSPEPIALPPTRTPPPINCHCHYYQHQHSTTMSLQASENNMPRLLKLAQKFNCFYLSGLTSGECTPFFVEGCQVGLVRPEVTKQLSRFPEVFRFTAGYIELNPAFRDYKERTNNVEKVLKQLRDENAFIALKGWRDECYEVKQQFSSNSFFKMDRSATCLFGIRNYGVDINGYVRHPTLGMCIWLQKRSSTKQTWPGKWDNMVSGGLSVGQGILETAHKEAQEEASVPTSLLKNLVSTGCVSFYFESERGLFPNTEFVFDLELPVDFIPENADGEVESFELLPVISCIERMFSADFKTTSAPVTLDFLMRHGFITAENEPHYARIMELLHVPLQTIYDNQTTIRIKQNGTANHDNINPLGKP